MKRPNAKVAAPRVAIVDDDQTMCDSISALLATMSIRSVLFTDPARFLRDIGKLKVTCIILDVRMPTMSGLEVQQVLLDRGITTPIIFVSAHGDIPMALRTVRAGALDFLEKPFRDQDLLDRIAESQRTAPARVKGGPKLSEFIRRFAQATPRESEVAWLVAEGLSNDQIANRLKLSRRTVEMHRLRLMRRLQLKKANELVSLLVKTKTQEPDMPTLHPSPARRS